ncbi:tetratricopeptide repeat-containing protein [Kordiimonas pumila]|uniref:Tetratricopeptide repeat-containing protein n=1 Tax=Kordiimonas pumila TaxID=2161677 RepID=A0ABV7D025_9PROT|nr:tetratricopeptide repeat-containing protein [Kordiimonas pumila]
MDHFQTRQPYSTVPLTPREGHKYVLSLLRAGAFNQAEKEFFTLKLDQIKDDEDILALQGRILKGKALLKQGPEKKILALQSAEKYFTAYTQTQGTYSGINTAAMYLVAGEAARAASLAKEIVSLLSKRYPQPGEDAYYHMATIAEAKLIFGDIEAAEAIFLDAISLDPHNYEARASTLIQFVMILTAMGKDSSWLDSYRPPKAVHYAGHIFGSDTGLSALDATSIHALEKTVDDMFQKETIGFAYGALAAGSDIVLAEAALRHGIELHVVLPCRDKVFLETSVSPFGKNWEARFYGCLRQAKSIRYVSEGVDRADDLTLSFGSEIAMGHAVLKAQALATEAVQLLIWNGQVLKSVAGTARDAAVWAASGRRQAIVPFPFKRTPTDCAHHLENKPYRSLKAMIFADVRGFGALPDAEVPLFLENVLKPLADCVQAQGQKLQYLNTWGDGMFLVFDTVKAAAKVALALQKCFQEIDLDAVGLPNFLALRVAGHYGPVYEMQDPFLQEKGVFGTEVTFAARIEPVTVPGSIYVSEPFACALAVNTPSGYACEYSGEFTPRKGLRPLPLFSLRTS